MKQYKYESRDCYSNHIKYHKSAWAAYNEAIRPKWAGSAYARINNNSWQLIKKGTTLMIAKGILDINRLITPHNHKLLSNGDVSTLCFKYIGDEKFEHYEITKPDSNSWYDVLYI